MISTQAVRWFWVSELDNLQLVKIHAWEKEVAAKNKKERAQHIGYSWHMDGQRMAFEFLGGHIWDKGMTQDDKARELNAFERAVFPDVYKFLREKFPDAKWKNEAKTEEATPEEIYKVLCEELRDAINHIDLCHAIDEVVRSSCIKCVKTNKKEAAGKSVPSFYGE